MRRAGPFPPPSINSIGNSSGLTSSRTRNSSVSTPYSRIGSVMGERYKFICAIVENRMREIGIAVLNLTRPEIELSTFTDNYTYLNILTKLTVYNPQEILLPKVNPRSELENVIATKYPQCNIIPIVRKYFDETRGAKYISLLSVPGSSIHSEVDEKYLCQAAIAALIKYVEYSQKTSFASHSLKITFVGKEGAMMIDSSSLWNLEVLCDARHGDKKVSLYGVINHTFTAAGARMLRVNLCQPPSDENTINTRLDCVEELLRNEKSYFEICSALTDLPNMDFILSRLVAIQNHSTSESLFQRNVATIIQLKALLERLPKISSALARLRNPLFQAMTRNYNDARISIMLALIAEMIHPNAQPKKNGMEMKSQVSFAIKEGVHGLLDVARKTFEETIDDIHSLIEVYKDRFSLPNLQLIHTAKRGYHLKIVSKAAPPLPIIFIQQLQQKKYIKFSSEELISLNDRQKSSTAEIFQLSNRLLEELFYEIRESIGAIYNVSDTTALLDMMLSFATFSSLHPSCRPNFVSSVGKGEEEGEDPLLLRIKDGKHPILSILPSTPSQHEFIANDTISCGSANFSIITGSNMSGKSTYIRQIALLVIMAQIGCFVTATSFSLKVVDHLFTRIGTSDSLEDNASSFMLEMREMAYILKNVSSRSLVIIDELGRGTSLGDACSLAWSCCESLLALPCSTFFVTHFTQLLHLADIYKNVTLLYLDSVENEEQVGFEHRVKKGIMNYNNHYGILLAQRRAGFPEQVIQDAYEVLRRLKTPQDVTVNDSKRKALVELCSSLRNLQRSSLEDTDLRLLFLQLRNAWEQQS